MGKVLQGFEELEAALQVLCHLVYTPGFSCEISSPTLTSLVQAPPLSNLEVLQLPKSRPAATGALQDLKTPGHISFFS